MRSEKGPWVWRGCSHCRLHLWAARKTRSGWHHRSAIERLVCVCVCMRVCVSTSSEYLWLQSILPVIKTVDFPFWLQVGKCCTFRCFVNTNKAAFVCYTHTVNQAPRHSNTRYMYAHWEQQCSLIRIATTCWRVFTWLWTELEHARKHTATHGDVKAWAPW